jgi:uncharacterized membrane protein YdbT with pleckstrin-like domain
MAEQQFDEQLDGEEVLFIFRKHPVVMRKGLILGLFGPVVGILPVAIWPQLGFGYFYAGLVGGILLGALLFLPSFIGWYFSVFVVTDQRFLQITRKGLFSKSIVDLSLKQVQSINYEVKGLQETLLGYGTLIVQTYIGDLVINDVEKPGKIYKKMLTILGDLGIDPVTLNNETNEEDE